MSRGETKVGNRQQFAQEFQQLGQDLQSGNLSAAQSDFATPQQNAPQGSALANASSSAQSGNPVASAFNQLSADLESGNLSGAQADFSTLQKDLQNRAGQMHHHHHGGAEAAGLSQDFQQLGQALQAGNLSGAQQAYTAMQQEFRTIGSGQTATQSGSTSQTTPRRVSDGLSG